MTGFDSELYLRRSGEQALLSGMDPHVWSDPLLDRARALVAVGAVPSATAQRVVDDYARARGIRRPGQWHPRHRPARPSSPPPPLAARRVVPSDHRFDQSWGQLKLRYVSFTDAQTRLAVMLWGVQQPRRGRRHRPGGAFAGGPPIVTVTDDRGTTASAHFSGGGNEEEWRGHYTTDQPLAVDTRWIDVFGERVDLPDRVDGAPVEIESLDDLDPAERYLQRLVERADDQHGGVSPVDQAIEALIACGALAADAAVVEETLAVAEVLNPTGAPPVASGAVLPAPWQSLLARRGQGGGPTGWVLVGALTPVFDGISAAVMDLESNDETFQIEVEVAGIAASVFSGDVSAVRISFTASDDRDNHYLGGLTGWSGSDQGIEGQAEFWPALDPLARRLDLALTAERSRAVIRVPLTWATQK